MAEAPDDDLLDRALELPKRSRAALAAALLASLEGEQDAPRADLDIAWAQEVRKRLDEVRDGTAELVEWDDVYRYLQSRRSK